MGSLRILRTAVAVAAMCGCAPVTLQRLPAPPCETAGADLEWVGPTTEAHRDRLSAWCQSVGPPVVTAPTRRPSTMDIGTHGLIVATWNVHVGGGDLVRFVDVLKSASPSGAAPAIVILVQEAARADDAVPAAVPAGVRAPRRIQPPRAPVYDISVIAERLGMWMAYVPSMRNGRGLEAGAREDRGSAILSTLPLSDVTGVELPWGAQRRVVVMATVEAANGPHDLRLRVASVHLNNRLSRRREAAAFARWLQLQATGPGALPIVVGADLNTWGGSGERTVAELSAVVPHVALCGEAPTFRWILGFRLDHLFTTLPADVLRGCEVGLDRFGSDHRPIVLRLFGR